MLTRHWPRWRPRQSHWWVKLCGFDDLLYSYWASSCCTDGNGWLIWVNQQLWRHVVHRPTHVAMQSRVSAHVTLTTPMVLAYYVITPVSLQGKLHTDTHACTHTRARARDAHVNACHGHWRFSPYWMHLFSLSTADNRHERRLLGPLAPEFLQGRPPGFLAGGCRWVWPPRQVTAVGVPAPVQRALLSSERFTAYSAASCHTAAIPMAIGFDIRH